MRCIELHEYGVCASLPNPGHRDRGSVVTMSALLTECDGGTFVTWDAEGRAVDQQLRQGDGVIFHSERVHNVSPVLNGQRRSLVVEMWHGKENSVDRND